MKSLVFVFALVALCVTCASGSSATISNIQVSDINSTFLNQAYNESVGDFPEAYKSLIGDNRIAIRIITEDNKVHAFGLVTKKGQLEEAVDGELKDPTIEIEVAESALTNLQEAEDPVAVFNKALDDQEISVKGNGFINQLKVNVLLGHPVLPELIVQLLSPQGQQATG
ncbi:MAG: hypothetical protein HPY61_00020 [Methanotrichaceae archaeon]|nr:hypothetical protein [Methanotrichaceae archaeon]